LLSSVPVLVSFAPYFANRIWWLSVPMRLLRTDAPDQMKLEIVIKHHLFALPKITVPIGDAPAIGNIASLSI
jgi:hypothetical protein